jgi:hypothetical protein
VATIEAYAQPPTLYRYRSLKEIDREIDAIEEGCLFCAGFTALNDPMEGLFNSSRHFRDKEDYRLKSAPCVRRNPAPSAGNHRRQCRQVVRLRQRYVAPSSGIRPTSFLAVNDSSHQGSIHTKMHA